MQKPFERTLTSDERAVFSNWLIRIAAFYGAAVLIIVGIALASNSGMERRSDTIALAMTGSIPSCQNSNEVEGPLCVSRKDNTEGARPERTAKGVTLPSGDFTMGMPLQWP